LTGSGLRKLKADAARAELELRGRKGELLDRQKGIDVVFRFGRTMRDRWQAWPVKVDNKYSRCLSDFELPLGLPVVAGNGVLTGADVRVDWHSWADKTFGGRRLTSPSKASRHPRSKATSISPTEPW
jgi:hypothetical protein